MWDKEQWQLRLNILKQCNLSSYVNKTTINPKWFTLGEGTTLWAIIIKSINNILKMVYKKIDRQIKINKKPHILYPISNL